MGAEIKETCSLCGWQFPKAKAACHGCILSKGCGLIKCPNCGYEFAAETESKVLKWFSKIFNKSVPLPTHQEKIDDRTYA
ncbi:MAG: hypothetical protein Q7S68_00890 [Deltaproteobacteria bacterium]|nr:hypothetical protein [Deltaproteobacteria bacterium]